MDRNLQKSKSQIWGVLIEAPSSGQIWIWKLWPPGGGILKQNYFNEFGHYFDLSLGLQKSLTVSYKSIWTQLKFFKFLSYFSRISILVLIENTWTFLDQFCTVETMYLWGAMSLMFAKQFSGTFYGPKLTKKYQNLFCFSGGTGGKQTFY